MTIEKTEAALAQFCEKHPWAQKLELLEQVAAFLAYERMRLSHQIDRQLRNEWCDAYAGARDERDRLKEVLKLAAPLVCRVDCPAVWQTDQSQPHSVTCDAVRDALAEKPETLKH